jgi:polyferredoxin
MLKKIRVILSVLLLFLITLYFLDFRDFLPESFSFLAEIQFIPALLAVNILVLASLLLLTLLFGRVYCSSICPMGIYQDIVAWFSKKFTRKKKYKYSKAKNVFRWSVLAATVVAFISVSLFWWDCLIPTEHTGEWSHTSCVRPIWLETICWKPFLPLSIITRFTR